MTLPSPALSPADSKLVETLLEESSIRWGVWLFAESAWACTDEDYEVLPLSFTRGYIVTCVSADLINDGRDLAQMGIFEARPISTEDLLSGATNYPNPVGYYVFYDKNTFDRFEFSEEERKCRSNGKP